MLFLKNNQLQLQFLPKSLLLQDQKTDEANREAAELYRRALLKDPTRWDAWANLAAALSDVGEEPKQAIRAFQRAIVLIEQAAVRQQGADEAQTSYLANLYFGLGAPPPRRHHHTLDFCVPPSRHPAANLNLISTKHLSF